MKKLLLFIGMAALMGCNVQQRQINHMQDYAVKYPGPFKMLANQLDPCFSGVAKADTVSVHDTTQLAGDTTVTTTLRHDTVTTVKTIKLPGQLITNKITILDTVTDGRQIASLGYMLTGANDSLTVVKTQLAASEKEESKFKLWFWLLAGTLIGGMLIFSTIKIYALVNGGTAANILTKL